MDKLTKASVGICVVSATLLSACDPDPKTTRIVARIASPDGTREAVHGEDMSGGATVGVSEDVYVLPKGRFPRLRDRVFSQDRACNVRVRWLNNDAVEIGYSARRATFEGSNAAAPVQVRLKWLGRDVANGC